MGALWQNPGDPGEKLLNPMVTGVPIHGGDLFRIVAPNGGGFGDPLARSPEQVREDVLDGFATLEQAREAYGVVIRGEGFAIEVDEEATLALREEMRATSEVAPV